MKLKLPKEWFDKNIPNDNPEVGVGLPEQEVVQEFLTDEARFHREEVFVEALAFGVFVQLLRRDRNLTIDQLASVVQISTKELISIERDPHFIPDPRTVNRISEYFRLPDRSLLNLANLTTSHNDRLRDAAEKFAATSSIAIELSREERAALTEFVHFLVAQEGA